MPDLQFHLALKEMADYHREMGGFFSQVFGEINSMQTVPLQKTGIKDGTSGLHYSGRTYSNQFQQLTSDVCKGATATVNQIGDIMPKSISSPSLNPDPTTKRISTSALQGHVNGLISQGVIPGVVANFDQQQKLDADFYAKIQIEYCFYEARYNAALTHFLSIVANPQGADQSLAQKALDQAVTLNQRLNSLLEIINYVGNERARKVNNRSPEIGKANEALEKKIEILQNQQQALTSNNARVRTQEEMVRYSAEKNRAMNIQIMFFVALNVVALGTIITVYKSVRPSTA